MSSINVILPAANAAPENKRRSHECSCKPGEEASPFGDVMKRALAHSSRPTGQGTDGAKESESESQGPSGTKGRAHPHGPAVNFPSGDQDEADKGQPQAATKPSDTTQTSQIPAEILAPAGATAAIPPLVTLTATGGVSEGTSDSDAESQITNPPDEAENGVDGTDVANRKSPRAVASLDAKSQVANPVEPKERAESPASIQNAVGRDAGPRQDKPALETEKQLTGKSSQAVQNTSPEESDSANNQSRSTVKSADPVVLNVVTAKDVPRPDPKSPPSATSEADSGGQSESHGISSAQQDAAMRKGEKMPNVAGPAEKELPGKMVTVGAEDLPPRQDRPSHASLRIDRPETITATTASPIDPVAKADESSAPATSALFVDPRARSLERTHDMVALHAMRLRDSNSDSLQVVIKPGAGLQLSLDLRQRDGGVEVQAILERGDFDHLNKHWADLQHRLESRGVRLASLSCSENFNNGGHGSFQQRHRATGDADPLAAGAFAEFAFAGSMTESVTRRTPRAKGHRGWETWA